MVELILNQIWSRLQQGWSNMADLADSIDDLICSFEGGGETTMDTVAMLIFGWMVFGLFVLLIGKYIYGRYMGGSGVPKDTKPVIEDISSVIIPSVSVSPEDGSVIIKAIPVPPTPPIRRRVSKKVSPGPAPGLGGGSRPLQSAASPTTGGRPASLIYAPQATGPDVESVKWVNRVFQWLYSDLVVVSEVIGVWIQALNDFTKKAVTEQGVGVEFVRVLPESHAPLLTSLFSECASNDDVTITCDFEATPALQVKAFRQRGEKVEVSHYRVNVNRLRARLNLVCITEKLLVDAKFDGWPDIKVSLAQVGSISRGITPADEQVLQDVIADVVVTSLRGATVHLNLGQYASCPRFDRYKPTPGPILPLHYDSMLSNSQMTNQKKLLVKVVKAVGLGSQKGCAESYCIVEMDEPAQKFTTSVKKDTNSPCWDESFIFELSVHTMELLFEIYDRKDHRFLGLGIVGVEELVVSPNQRQVIALQSRPYEADQVSGTLTVEFMFADGENLLANQGDQPFKLKETLKSVSPTGAVITTTKTIFSKPGDQDGLANGMDGVADTALRELELRNVRTGANTQASKSTLIIHSVQRQGTREGAMDMEPTNGVSSLSSDGTLERSRSRRKKRDFFGTIKKRLSRSKNRSKSMDPGERDESLGRDSSLSRSVSADRARDAAMTDPARVAGGYLSVPRGLDGTSTRSSLSEASGISGASTRTYVSEASTLVLETIENGVKKHYLVPLSLAQKSKWRKKGVKLHIFNDHTFVAKHLPGGTICPVCTKSVARRIGKQGYECRDCLMRCHKHCHVKADNTCPNSTIQSIELSLLPVLSE